MTEQRIFHLLDRLGPGPGRAGFQVPGRVEVLGKHTDYAGGRSLLCATARGFAVAVGRRDDDRIHVIDSCSNQLLDLSAGSASGHRPRWALYPETVLRRARSDFSASVPGCSILLRSDLPSAAGLSSSSALMIGIFLALDAVARFSRTAAFQAAIRSRTDLAAYLASVERGSPFPGLGKLDHDQESGVGTRGGGQDHTAILCAEAGRLVRYAFEPPRREATLSVPTGWTFAIGASGVRASKAGGARDRYNRLSDLARQAAERWRSATGRQEPHLGAIATAGPGAMTQLQDILAGESDPGRHDALQARVSHFVAESEEIVPDAHAALTAGDMPAFGELVDRSQALAEQLLGNQVPQTAWLAGRARRLGAAAASAFGAGFGGSVWALVPDESSSDFLRRWRDAYHAAHGRKRRTAWFTTDAAAPARQVV